jgi:hypothetical protein
MDLSFWNKLSSHIYYEPTRKQFYNRFCYKLVIEVVAGRIIQSKVSIDDEIAHRRKMRDSIKYNYGGSWMARNVDNIDKVSVEQLEILRSIRNGYGTRIKMRVEEPWVQIYTEDLQTLKDIANRFPPDLQQKFMTVSFPESEEKQQLLEQGKILVRPSNKIAYKYKVFLRDGNYSSDIKRSVYNFLMGLGPDVKVSTATASMLLNGHSFIWGGFLYVNDPAVLTMVSIISPTIIGKIHELVGAEN